jgi:fructokinase
MVSDASVPLIYGAIEGGGTKFVCAVGSSPTEILESVTIPTTDAVTTLGSCVSFFRSVEAKRGRIAAFGVSCFGPIELRPASADFGRLMATPKAGWSGVNVLDPLRAAFAAPIAIDTDVGAAALAELSLGAGRGLASLAYVTVGTGIGGALAPAGSPDARLIHAEMGHIPVRRDARDRQFAGVCPFHGDCLEGLASGPAIVARWGTPFDALPADHEGREIIAGYLGQLAASIALMLSAERVVFGGGVMTDGRLLSQVRDAAARYLNGYLAPLKDERRLAEYVCAPVLGVRAGISGALLLALRASKTDRGASA